MNDQIIIKGAHLHNLKNINLEIPKNKLVVFTGLSGSGKSTLAFDTLYREGTRQYMESLGMVIHDANKAAAESISGLSPSISVDQYLTNRSPRSTVGTATEVFTYLRVLFARLGHRPCPACGQDVPPESETDEELWDEDDSGPDDGETIPCPHCGARLPALNMGSFSFNKPAGACPTCTGLGVVGDLLLERVFDPARGVADGGVMTWDPFNLERFVTILQRAGEHYGFVFDVHQPVGELGEVQHDLLYYGVTSQEFKRHYPKTPAPTSVTKGYFEGVITNLRRRYNEGQANAGLVPLETLFVRQTCYACGGTRLRSEIRQVKVTGWSIDQVAKLSLEEVSGWIEGLPPVLKGDEHLIAGPVIEDLRGRIRRLVNLGVGYLTLDRTTFTLSAGEAQRLRLAALVGSGLTGVLYVLDEPTIGLHQRDTGRLIGVLKQLRDLGNTVLVIEHDLEMIRAADFVVEFGPGAGKHGGEIVVCGTPDQVAAHPTSPTGGFLSGRVALPVRPPRQNWQGELTIYGARQHNLKDITVSIPLGRLVAVTGVSGSGKSSLMFDILDAAAHQRFNGSKGEVGAHDQITGWEKIDRVVTVDQTPIGRVPRSSAATYTEVFTAIRETYARLEEARQRRLSPKHFSFNVPGGRCERCEGAGVLTVNMHFLPDVQVRCPTCHGKRFKKDVLAVKYRGADISQVLEMTIEEALALFAAVPAIADRLKLLSDTGLGYLQLGQPATTLSGGEAQRVKLAKELAHRGTGRTLYLLDEPTTGLHSADIARLLELLQRLVEAGNSVIVVEHQLELIHSADWVIDLGPEGGSAGGQLIAEGTPAQVAQAEGSQTGRYLKMLMGV